MALKGLGLVCALVAPLAACAPEKEVWFTPNIGSPDMLDLFTRPEQWSRARSQVRVFKFKACATLDIRFGVIFWGQDGTNGRAYYDDVLGWVRTVGEAVGRPEDVVFQSWLEAEGGRQDVPVNLPEDDPAVYSHTRLLDDWLAPLEQLEASR